MGNARRPRKKAFEKKESAVGSGSQAGENTGAGGMETLYCTCQRPYADGDLMVCCDSCGEWFHPRCVAVSAEEVQSLPLFVCPGCLEEAAAATATEARRSLAERFRNERQRYLQQERQRRHDQRVIAEPPAIKLRLAPAGEKERTLQEDQSLFKNKTGVSASKRKTDISNEQASLTVLKKRKSSQEKIAQREKMKEHVIKREQATSTPETVRNRDAASTEIVRSKARRMLSDALQAEAADEIESALFELMGRQVHDDYRARLRNLVANLRDPRNGELREAVLSGALPPNALCQMNSEELACKELRMKRQEQLSRAEKLRVIERAEEVGLVFKEVAPLLARESNALGTSSEIVADAAQASESKASPDAVPYAQDSCQDDATCTQMSDGSRSSQNEVQSFRSFGAADKYRDQEPTGNRQDPQPGYPRAFPTSSGVHDTSPISIHPGNAAPVRCFQENAFAELGVEAAEPFQGEDHAGDSFRGSQTLEGLRARPLETEAAFDAKPSSPLKFLAWSGSIATSAAPPFKPVLRLSEKCVTSSTELSRLVELLGGQNSQMSETARIRQRDALSFIRDVHERSSTRKVIFFHLERDRMDPDAVAQCQRATEEFRKRDRASLLIRDEILEVYFLPVAEETEEYLGEACSPDGALLACVVRRDALATPAQARIGPADAPKANNAPSPGFDVGLALQILSKQLH